MHEHVLNGLAVRIVIVVAHHRLHHRFRLPKSTDEVGANDVVGTLDFVSQHFADIVEKRRTSDHVDVGADL